MTENKNTNFDAQSNSHSDPQDSTSDPSHNSSNTDSWEQFISEHESDLHDVDSSLSAKRFKRKAEKIDRKNMRNAEKEAHEAVRKARLNISDFKDNVFVNKSNDSNKSNSFNNFNNFQAGPHDYRVSWLDADEADNHFTPGDPGWSSHSKLLASSGILILIGFVLFACAIFIPVARSFAGFLCFIFLILGFGSLFVTHKNRSNSTFNQHNDGAQV